MRRLLRSAGWKIFNLLDQYIKLTNSSLSFWNTIRRSEFFRKQSNKCIFIMARLQYFSDEFKKIKKKHNLDRTENEFINCLADYTKSLYNSVSLFRQYLKMMSSSRNPNEQYYSKKEITDIFNKIKKSDEKYVKIGGKLKNLFEKL